MPCRPAKETADYHALRGDVDLIRHDLIGYEKELLEAKRRDPQDRKYNLALATLQVAANDFATYEVGVRELLDLCDDKSLRRDAMHRLADDALRRNQITRALEYARDLDSLPNRDFSDRLLLLSILKAANEAETQSLLAPKNPDYAATYAFSLYRQGDVKKALQALAGFSEGELERPQIAAYYGVLLANSGDFSRAAKFLDLGKKADLLLEEKKLVEKAQLTVAQR